MEILGFNRGDLKVTYNLIKMTLRDRYLGSHLGMFWAVFNPLLLMGMYTFVFGFILKSKVPGSESSLIFVIWLLGGFAPWLAVSEGLNNSANSVVSGASLVKNIVFKTELLPIATTICGMVPMLVGLAILFTLLLITGIGISWNLLWLLVVIPIQVFFLIGLGFFFAAVTVFIRDVAQVLGSLLLLLLFFTPIFYSLDQMPRVIQKITFFNPFYQAVAPYRTILIDKQSPEITGFLYLMVISVLLWYGGLKFFRKCKPYFESFL